MVELEEIGSLRRRLRLTQKELAKRANVSQSLIAKIEAGMIDPSYSKAKLIIDTLESLGNDRMKAAVVMNKNIISVRPDDSIKKAIDKMKRYNISQMPVVEDRKVLGLVSEAIILEALVEDKGNKSEVRDIMRDCPPIITGDASLNIVTNLLREYPIILVSEKGRLRGHITKSDLLTKAFR